MASTPSRAQTSLAWGAAEDRCSGTGPARPGLQHADRPCRISPGDCGTGSRRSCSAPTPRATRRALATAFDLLSSSSNVTEPEFVHHACPRSVADGGQPDGGSHRAVAVEGLVHGVQPIGPLRSDQPRADDGQEDLGSTGKRRTNRARWARSPKGSGIGGVFLSSADGVSAVRLDVGDHSVTGRLYGRV